VVNATIEKMATVLKALGEPTRLKIIKLLSIQELCVCEIESVLNISQPRVSQHLKVLKVAGIVRERKDRQRSFFGLDASVKQGELDLFRDFMKSSLDDIPDLAEEKLRLATLDSNEEVQACKGSLPPELEKVTAQM